MTHRTNFKPPRHRTCWKSTFIGILSLILGIAALTVSTTLLSQSTTAYKTIERGKLNSNYSEILSNPFRNSNWTKTSIPLIVLSSFGIVLGVVQIMSSFILTIVHGKHKLVAVVVWLGAHIFIVIFNIICFSIAMSVKAQIKRDTPEFWKNYQLRSTITHNIEGHVYCSVLAGNTLFILITVSILTPTLNTYYDLPISLPEGSY